MKKTRLTIGGAGITAAALALLVPSAANAVVPTPDGTVAATSAFTGTSASLAAPLSGTLTVDAPGAQKVSPSGNSLRSIPDPVANCVTSGTKVGEVVRCGTYTQTFTFSTPVSDPVLRFGTGSGNSSTVRTWVQPKVTGVNGSPAPALSLVNGSDPAWSWAANTLSVDVAAVLAAPDTAMLNTTANVQLNGAVSSVTVSYDWDATRLTAGTVVNPDVGGLTARFLRAIEPVTVTVSAKDDDAKAATLTGKGEPGATITVSTPNGPKTATVGPDGTWSVDVDGLAEGANAFTAVQEKTDSTGATVTSSADTSVTIDAADVPTPLTAQVDSKDDDAKTAVISGNGTPGATVTVTTPTGPADTTVKEDGTWSLEVSGLAEGQNDLPVTSGDESADVTVIIAAQEVPVLLGLAGAGVLGAGGVVIGRRKRSAQK
ncbi:Ig-like domain-containing protein [Leifsonia shinshuensis]|uniref:Bacterial Ig domain-containing protein n=1 Tax=Leifsonia shinshuensis TaxID=150026 RepID=A0A7G6Y9W6_9MICO|nr:Ig-like domain-containing protein [Leifsonia shinshuensis]QNE35281.1 hypothetical protein F1C12_09155 [Leifsonia shinshuensis]